MPFPLSFLFLFQLFAERCERVAVLFRESDQHFRILLSDRFQKSGMFLFRACAMLFPGGPAVAAVDPSAVFCAKREEVVILDAVCAVTGDIRPEDLTEGDCCYAAACTDDIVIGQEDPEVLEPFGAAGIDLRQDALSVQIAGIEKTIIILDSVAAGQKEDDAE